MQKWFELDHYVTDTKVEPALAVITISITMELPQRLCRQYPKLALYIL